MTFLEKMSLSEIIPNLEMPPTRTHACKHVLSLEMPLTSDGVKTPTPGQPIREKLFVVDGFAHVLRKRKLTKFFPKINNHNKTIEIHVMKIL